MHHVKLCMNVHVQGQHSDTKRTHAELAIALCVFVAGAVVAPGL